MKAGQIISCKINYPVCAMIFIRQTPIRECIPLHLFSVKGMLITIHLRRKIMDYLLVSLILAVLGAAIAFPIRYAFSRMPEAWLQDYDFDPKAKDFRAARRMNLFPHTIAILALLVVVYFLTGYMNPSFIDNRWIFHIFLALSATVPLSMIIMSDTLNRIIPDQLTIVAAILCIFGFLGDFLEGSLWIPSGSPWYYFLLNRILGGIIGGVLFWGFGFLGSMFTGRESLGFGDVKLIFACGLLSGAYGLPFVVFIAFTAGGIMAIPLVIRKRLRIRKEEQMVLMSEDPDLTLKHLEQERNAMHYADDPDYIAFGPFLAIGTIAFLMLETSFQVFFSQQFFFLFS